ncbi:MULTISPECIES: glutathione S-transferase [Chromohalobacter]|uniref:Glutathione S-transferase n=2 Tax=Chromohalobacter TaxID=42054 RepID=A0A1Q8TA99_9GAMM|nr:MULTISPECIES: glutathione S-transferase [Chromohalobacter]MCK0751963.1 glutathione S-transferase family protein [Chromohalobacter japonicus]MCK0765187.1 glutathione S-transferase family protein [Chromohalobacter beijerinckii]OLO10610.1 glutathione S-transferase [Chromohalobacter japonicus]
MQYELYYWPGIPGRGEYVRLALEAAGADYVDVARECQEGVSAIGDLLEGQTAPFEAYPPFAPPILKAQERLVSHVANILRFLGPRLDLVPDDDASRDWAHGLQLTMTDFIAEIHDVHHPIGSSLYYEEQQDEARRRSHVFRQERLGKFLGYFEDVLARNPAGKTYLVGDALSYVDLSLFQTVSGLHYAMPRAMAAQAPSIPGVMALSERVSALPRIATYLGSARRQAFNEDGIFRHYLELDAD